MHNIKTIEKELYNWGEYVAKGGGANNMLWYKQSCAYRLALPSKMSMHSYDIGFIIDIDLAIGKIANGIYRKLARVAYTLTHLTNNEKAKELSLSVRTFIRYKTKLINELIDYFNRAIKNNNKFSY